MTARTRGIRGGILALSLGGLLAGCSDGGGGLQAFFGMNNNGSCSALVVDVDLAAASAVVDFNKDGTIDCVKSALLEDAGCNVTFQTLNNGGTLHVQINGCTVDAVASLFQCGFDDGDLSALQDAAFATCACSSAGCDTSPPLCVSKDGDPASCEDCSNGKDDDGNGLTDCQDPNCSYIEPCGPVETTTTTLPETTTTTLPVTTTTLQTGTECTFRFRIASDVNVGSIQWTTDYTATGGDLIGTGDGVECTSLVNGALAAFADDDAENVLSTGLISLDGIDGPADVAQCHFIGDSVPSASDFVINVSEASLPDLTPLDPLPSVVITNIDCGAVTTTTSTSTTLEPTTTTTLGGDTPKDYIVKFHLDSASAGVGALQWTADYTAATGGFQGSGSAVSCTNNVAGALFAPNDVDATKKLTLGIIALTPFSAGIDLVTCTFNGFANDAPTPADIAVTLDDATDSDGNPIDAAIGVLVSPAP